MSNKFSGILDAPRARKTEPPPEEPQELKGKSKGNGKSSNPDYKQISAYVRKDTHRAAVKKLLDEPEGQQDLSDVIEKLLNQWIKEAA